MQIANKIILKECHNRLNQFLRTLKMKTIDHKTLRHRVSKKNHQKAKNIGKKKKKEVNICKKDINIFQKDVMNYSHEQSHLFLLMFKNILFIDQLIFLYFIIINFEKNEFLNYFNNLLRIYNHFFQYQKIIKKNFN